MCFPVNITNPPDGSPGYRHVKREIEMSENPTLVKQTIAEALDYAIQEHGLDDMGFDTSYAAGIVLEALEEAGLYVVGAASIAPSAD